MYVLTILLSCSCVLATFSQDNRNVERSRTRSMEDTVPLEKLLSIENGKLVVTPEIRKALEALGANSVVLSAERYRELMKLQNEKKDKNNKEIIFARCQMSGMVRQITGKEYLDLTLDLEFRTEEPNSVIPIPCKGLRLTMASINGRQPIWGPDPEKWTIHIKEPAEYKLKVQGLVPVLRNGYDRKIQMEKIPASAITGIEFKVPAPATNALIVGYGTVPVATSKDESCIISASALGILSSLELTWQATTTAQPSLPQGIEGDIQVYIQDAIANTEVKLKPLPFNPVQLPWKIRLPSNILQLRAELIRGDNQGAESLIATKQSGDIYVVDSPYPLSAIDFTQLQLRWQQNLPAPDSIDSIALGICEVLEPAKLTHHGTITVTQPEQSISLLKPVDVELDRENSQLIRDAKQSVRYRYSRQPACLEAVTLPLSQARGVADFRVKHVLNANIDNWQLTTTIELIRSTKSNLSQLEFFWPAKWQVNRRLLFSSIVKDLEQDSKSERLRIILDTKETGTLQLRIDSKYTDNPESLEVILPQLQAVSILKQQRMFPVELITSSELLQIEANETDVEYAVSTKGFNDNSASNVNDNIILNVIEHPAIISLSKNIRLPKYSTRAEIMVGQERTFTKQYFSWNAGSMPRSFAVYIPDNSDNVQFFLYSDNDMNKRILLPAELTGHEEPGIRKYAIKMSSSDKEYSSLLVLMQTNTKFPWKAPLSFIDSSISLMKDYAIVSIKYETGINMVKQNDSTSWKVVSTKDGNLTLEGDNIKSALSFSGNSGHKIKPQVIRNIEYVVSPLAQGWLIESKMEEVELRRINWIGKIHAKSDELKFLGWKLNNKLMKSEDIVLSDSQSVTSIGLELPIEYLHTLGDISLAWIYQPRSKNIASRIPYIQWDDSYCHSQIWLISADTSHWLLWTSGSISSRSYPSSVWKPIGLVENNERLANSIEIVDAGNSTHLAFVLVPRHIALMVGCIFSFITFSWVSFNNRWMALFSLIGLVAVGYWLSLPTATIIIWCMLIALVLLYMIYIIIHYFRNSYVNNAFYITRRFKQVENMASSANNLDVIKVQPSAITANIR